MLKYHETGSAKGKAILDKFYKLQKDINRREKRTVSGTELDRLQKEAKEFVAAMKEVIVKKR